MTRLAFAGKCGFASGYFCSLDPAIAENKPGLRSDPSAATPMPVAARPKKWRRVINRLFSRNGFIKSSALRDGFVQVQNHGGDGCPRGQLGGVATAVGFPRSHRKEFLRGFLVILK